MYTRHAEERMQQRDISELEILMVYLYGEEFDQKGGDKYLKISNKGFKKMLKQVKKLFNKPEKLRELFVIDAGAAIKTVGYKYRNIHTH